MTNVLAEAGPFLCDCDAPEGGRIVSVDVALQKGLSLAARPVGAETVPLAAATGRILAEPATTPHPLPPFDNSAMDGYGVRLADLSGPGPWRLPVEGRVAAGRLPPASMPTGTALRILTGAPVPPWVDAVVMQEHVEREAGAIVVAERPREGLNIRRCGEDLPAGAPILPAGVLVGAREAAALASTGAPSVTVHRRLRVSFFSTGSELVEPGAALGPAQIHNSNRPMLAAALDRPWIEARDLGAVADDPAKLADTLMEAAREADLVISTGGVSVGDEDHMPAVFRKAGGDIHALRVAMKPGKPLAVGRMGGAIYLGLPGNPVSAFITWLAIGEPVAKRRAGLSETRPARTLVTAGFDVERRPGRCEFRPVRIAGYDGLGRPRVELLSPSYSARVALLAAADGLAILPAEAERIAAGDLLDFIPLA